MPIFNILTRKKSKFVMVSVEDSSKEHSVDAAISEEHVRESEVTNFPVEDGTNISDHIIIQPEQLTIEGIISESPVQYLTNILDSSPEIDLADAWKEIESLWRSGAVLKITTGLQEYPEMICTSLVVPRDGTTGHSIRIKATFQEWRVAETSVTGVAENILPGDDLLAAASAVKENVGKVASKATAASGSALDILSSFIV